MGNENPGERQWARQDKSRGNISEMQVRERSGAVRRHEETGPRRGDFGSNRKGTRLCCLLPVSSPTPLPMLHFIYCLILTLPSFVRSPFFAGSAWPMRSGRTTTEGATPWWTPTTRALRTTRTRRCSRPSRFRSAWKPRPRAWGCSTSCPSSRAAPPQERP